jgi:predicted lipoprotein with Yx(FWY)xxD motif
MGKISQQTTQRLRIGGIAATALAVGGLSASVVVAGPAGATTSRVAKAVAVTTAKVAKIGTVLASGKTLYTLKPSATPCTAACLKIWPALVLPKGVTKAKAGSGVNASKLGVKSSGGTRQVTYGGKPLYTFVGDSGPGQVHGNVTDAWGKWTAVVTAKSSSSSGSGSSSSGGSSSGSGGAGF